MKNVLKFFGVSIMLIVLLTALFLPAIGMSACAVPVASASSETTPEVPPLIGDDLPNSTIMDSYFDYEMLPLGSEIKEFNGIWYNANNTLCYDSPSIPRLNQYLLSYVPLNGKVHDITLQVFQGYIVQNNGYTNSVPSVIETESFPCVLILYLRFDTSSNSVSLNVYFCTSEGPIGNFLVFTSKYATCVGNGCDLRNVEGAPLGMIDYASVAQNNFGSWFNFDCSIPYNGSKFIFSDFVGKSVDKPVLDGFSDFSKQSINRVAKCYSSEYDHVRNLINQELSKYISFGYKLKYKGDTSMFNSGYNAGVKDGYDSGLETGKKNGYNIGFNAGHNQGVEDANTYSFLGLISAVVDAPLNTFKSLFDFDILGTNMKSFMLSLFTLAIILCVFKIILGRL